MRRSEKALVCDISGSGVGSGAGSGCWLGVFGFNALGGGGLLDISSRKFFHNCPFSVGEFELLSALGYCRVRGHVVFGCRLRGLLW